MDPPFMSGHGDDESLAFVVSGNHMSGLARGHELPLLGARRVGVTATAPDYRLFVLATQPPKPGLVRMPAPQGTASIEVEEWQLPLRGLGRLLAELAAPQAIGRITLVDGRCVHGFVVQHGGLVDAVDITACGSWRWYLARPPQPVSPDHLPNARPALQALPDAAHPPTTESR